MNNIQNVLLGELIRIKKGKKPLQISDRIYSDKHLPYLLIESMEGQNKLFTDDTSCPTAKKEDTLLVWDGARSGLSSTGQFGYVGSTLVVISKKSEIIDSRYLFYFISSKQKQIHYSSEGTGIPHVSRRFLENLQIPVPPLPEQKKIAEIISGIDKKISLSRKKVDKLSCLLKAIFNFESLEKECSSFVPLSEIGVWRGGGTPSKSIHEYWKGSIPWVSPKDMKGNRIYNTEDHITSKAIENSSALLIKKGSILFVVRSGILRNKLPIAFAEKDLTINQDLKSLQINSQWDKDFIFYFLKSNSDKIRTSCMKVGTTVESIASDLLMEYMIPCVSKSIQENLGKVARRIDQSIEFENYLIDSIIMLKNALLQDLLSGRKRVNI